MNTAKLKKYAPQARREFITAVSKQLNQLGIYSDKQISEVKQEGSVLLIEGKTFDPSVKTARERLIKKVREMGYNQLLEQVAYTLFNRLCAIRYMEIHDYLGHGFRVLSHPDNPKGFEIIDHAQDAADELGLDRACIIELKLAGNKDEELYRELLLGQCHKLHEAMPFLFDALDDETELLLPDNLTRTDSILRGLVDSIPEEDWQQVEVIGWLYQFYISEKKDQVMGKVVKSEDIPAATQLFTPNWIVKYLVQNSVCRQWLETYPKSDLLERLKEIDRTKKQKLALLRGETNIDDIKGEVFYIHPAEQTESARQHLHSIVPESIEPDTIKVLDPACGSGHILIEAYNVLKAIYEERGFRSRDIPKMILENNLYGLDIDDRAAQLSGFALMMMARDDDKRIFTRNVRLNVLSLQESNHIDLPTLWKALNLSGSWQSGTSQGLFSDEEQDLSSFNADNRYQLLKRTLARFTQAKTFGSLIDVPSDEHEQLKELLSTLVELQESGDSMQKPAAKQLIEIVHQSLVLSVRYDAVIANPPYMGSKGMNADLKEFAKKYYPNSKSDLFAIFMERAFSLLSKYGFNAQINMQSWMFLSSYEQLRNNLLEDRTLITMAHLGARAFGQISGEIVQTTAWIFNRDHVRNYQPKFYRLVDGAEEDKKLALESRLNEYSSTVQDDLKKIPGSPIAYWTPEKVLNVFEQHEQLYENSLSEGQNITANNDRYLRMHWEVNSGLVEAAGKWSFYSKGGPFRKWYGNIDNVVDWSPQAQSDYRSHSSARIIPEYLRFREGVTWTLITSTHQSFRFLPSDATFDKGGSSIFFKDSESLKKALLFLNSKVAYYLTKLFNATLNLQVDDVRKLPLSPSKVSLNSALFDGLIELSKFDWDLRETSKDFKRNYLIHATSSLKERVAEFNKMRKEKTAQLAELEECNNRYFIELYGLTGLLSPEVDEEQLTVDLNEIYLFGRGHDAAYYDDRYRSNLISEFVSYSIGNMMGRFSLDREGLVYSFDNNKGFEEFIGNGSFKSFPADEDGIIPLTDQEWFKDDATNRFREFVQVVWGEEHLQENLDFVAESLCLNAIKPKKSESALETIRRYLSAQFYKDHLKTYKKRPIYWLFSSGKQKAFECLVYLHRYNEGTLSRMRTEYVTPLLGKYDAYAEQLEKQIETADSTSEANRFKKELDALIKKQVELREFDDKLKHYADMRISLDLDDGVKVNYGKFGDLLADVKAITGSAPEVN